MSVMRLILFVWLVVTCRQAFADGGIIGSSLFENYSVSNGLSDEKIHCVTQDSKGWIWLGTDYGVYRFDGYSFSPFPVKSSLSQVLTNSLIRKIVEDSDGNIWIGTDFQGLFLYERKINSLKQFKDKGFPHNSVWDIIPDNKGNLWLATEGGLVYFNPRKGEVENAYTTSNSNLFYGNWIRKLFLDANGNLWVGSNKGLTVINQQHQRVEAYFTGDDYKERENEVWEIFQDNHGMIWIGTYLGGLQQFNPAAGEMKTVELDRLNSRTVTVRSIIQDKKGDLWFGTRGGLYCLNEKDKNIKVYKNEPENSYSLIHNSVLNLFIDKKGDLWIGTRNGLSYLNFDRQAFGYICGTRGNQQLLNNSEVYVLWENNEQQLWIGTESGGINIYHQQKDKISYLTSANGLSVNCIKSITAGNRGEILIGTYLGGLNIYNPANGKVSVFMHQAADSLSISDNEVWAVLRDSKGRIWVGTSKGLDVFDDVKGKFHHYGPRFHIEMASMIFEDSKGNLWVNSSDQKELTLIKTDNTTLKFPIQSRAMCEDVDGNLWLATQGDGLIKLDNNFELIEHFTTSDGLCSNILNGIINVNNDYLWISTNNGISKFSIERRDFKNYFSSDGLLNNKFNYGAFCRTKSNHLVFGGQLGVDFVFLDKINKNDYVPPIAFTGFRLFNKPVEFWHDSVPGILSNHISETDSIVLAYDQNMLSFDFAALNYANSNKNKYRYKLEGFDKQWNDVGLLRVATYTNLEHGDYTLHVLGSNNDNLYNEEGASLSITILPPVWKTWWFRTLAIIFLLFLFYLIFILIRNREKLKHELIYERQTARKLQEIDRLKHQFFMNMSHEIRTPLTLIVGPLGKLLEQKWNDSAVKTNLELIHKNVENLKRLINQLLDYRKLETGNLHLDLKKGNLRVFASEIVDTFRSMAKDRDITIEFKAFHDIIFVWFDAEKVEKIINNLLSNALKFSPNNSTIIFSITQVFVEDINQGTVFIPPLDVEGSEFKKFIKIKIIDQGPGISADDLPKIFNRFNQVKGTDASGNQGSGIGLALTKEMARVHHGHIKVVSSPGEGSRFSFYMPYITKSDSVTEGGEELLEETNVGEEAEASPKNQAIVLVVDDNPDLRKFIKTNFEPYYLVYEAKDGKEGWDKALDVVPDLIIADVMMPGWDGNELCRRLKKDERTSHIPVIMLSALGSSENQLAGIDAGADDYLTKPFDVALLKAKADNILSIRKALRERYSKELVLRPKDIVVSSPDEKFLKKLIALVEKNMANEELDVDFLAKGMDVSRTQLYRKIAALTDMSPKEFVKDQRLKRATQLILQNSMNISEVAYAVGFSDVAYFRKCFRESFGMSPTEYLQNNS